LSIIKYEALGGNSSLKRVDIKIFETPVVLVIFNRPNLTKKVFEQIAKVRPKKLYIIADGPRFNDEKSLCDATRDIINLIDWDCNLETDFSDMNMGPDKRIYTGMNWVFSKEDKAIVLEDDCLPTDSFFYFCEELLNKYNNDEKIMHINGTNLQNGVSRTDSSYYFSIYPWPWGWATWKRAWDMFDYELKSLPKFKEEGRLNEYFKTEKEQQFFSKFFESHDLLRAWDLKWLFNCIYYDALSITPDKNLVSNIGSINSTHIEGTKDSILLLNSTKVVNDIWNIKHSNIIKRNEEADRELFRIAYQDGHVIDSLLDDVDIKSSNSKMKRVDIKTGFLCNNNCLFCVQADNKCKGNRGIEEIKKNLDECKDRCQEVVLTGGEVTIRKDFLEIIKYARQIGYPGVQIQSNGRMFSSLGFCKKVMGAGATSFALALHGYCKGQHDELTKASGSFKQTVEGIRNLKSLGAYVLLNTVVVKQNYKDLEKIAKLLVSLNVDQFQLAFVHAMGNAWLNYDEVVPKMSEAAPYIHKGLQIGIDAGKSVMAEAMPYCMMKGYEDYVAEKFIPDSEIRGLNFQNTDDFSFLRKNHGKMKFPQCKECKYDSVCEGPWNDYPKKMGEEEFKAVK